MIFNAAEWGPTDIPIEYVMKDGKFNIYPEVQRKGYFNILFRSNSLTLTAGEYIGLIPLNDNVAIHVQPKVPLDNLIHFISKSGEKVTAINFEREYSELRYFSPNIFEFIIRSLLFELRNMDKLGVFRKYTTVDCNDGMPRGKLLFKGTMRNIMRHQNHNVSYSYFMLDKDIPENRCIKYALWLVLNYFKDLNYEPRNLVREAAYFYRMLEHIKLDRDRQFLLDIKNILKKNQIPSIRQYYSNILRTSLFVINRSSIAVERFEGEEVRFPSFVIKMSDVFEKYLLCILKEGMIKRDVRVLNGNTSEGMKKLFLDTPTPTANPDIVIRKDETIPIIIDAKYKEKPRREDLNQIISYCLSYGSSQGLLVCPKTSDLIGEEYIGEISGIRIFTYYFNLENKDILKEEQTFIDYIAKRV